MASTPSILITGSTSGAGTAGQAKTDLVAGETITLSDSANTSGTYSWELWVVDGSAVTLTNANTATPTFVCVAEESYLAFCEVDGVKSYSINAAGDRVSTQGGAAVLKSGERNPVPGETDQFGGWDGAFVNLLNDYRDGALGGGGGSITGPVSSTDNALVRWDGTGGDTLQNGSTTEDDSGNVTVNGNIVVTGTVDGRDVATDGTKLDGIEASATADQTGAEIKTAYEAEADTNAFTDAEQTKLSGIETSADVTDATNVAAAGAVMDSEMAGTYAGHAIRTGSAAYAVLKHNLAAAVAPTTTDDSASDYAVGSLWIDTTADKAYVCLDATATAAVWTETTGGAGGSGDVTGPASSSATSVALFDGTTGKAIKEDTTTGLTYVPATGVLRVGDTATNARVEVFGNTHYIERSGNAIVINGASTGVNLFRNGSAIVSASNVNLRPRLSTMDIGETSERWVRGYIKEMYYAWQELTTTATIAADTAGGVLLNAGTAQTATLPDAPDDGASFMLSNTGAGTWTVAAGASDTLSGSVSASMAQDTFQTLVYRASSNIWYRVG